MRSILLGSFLMFFTLLGYSQIKNIGIPSIHNYYKRDYKAGKQTWDITQDKRGWIYFANNEGLLCFDGVNWTLHRMPNASVVRSSFVSSEGVLYVGAYNEFGKMTKNTTGEVVFQSFKDQLPLNEQKFDDVWSIIENGKMIVFQTNNALYFFLYDKLSFVIKAPSRIIGCGLVDRTLYVSDSEIGLCRVVDQQLVPLSGCQSLIGDEIASFLPQTTGVGLLICTRTKGIFSYLNGKLSEWNGVVNAELKKNQIYKCIRIQDNCIAFGTIQNGLIITNSYGEVLQRINREQGLQNNTVLSLFLDGAGDLWLGLDNGIDYLNINSPISFIRTPQGLGTGYASLVFRDLLYLGTNQGLYVMNWNNGRPSGQIRFVDNTSGQVWHLSEHRGIVVCGHNLGTFVVDGDKAKLISKLSGGWKYLEMKKFPGYLFAGTYAGLSLFKFGDKGVEFVKKIPGFDESFRVFEEDQDGSIWMSHGFKGIYRIRFGASPDQITETRYFNIADGLPSNYNLSVYKVKGKVIVTSKLGVYEYDPRKNKFVPSVYFNQILSPFGDISYLKEDPVGNIWFVAWVKASTVMGVLKPQEDGSYKLITLPFKLLSGKFVNGFESIATDNQGDYFISIEDGFAHYAQNSKFRNSSDFSAYITSGYAVHLDSLFYDSSIQGPNSVNRPEKAFSYPKNVIRFNFSVPVYDDPGGMLYSYYLRGSMKRWSDWTSSTSAEFPLLAEGSYTFQVKARNSLNVESQMDELTFAIYPPWYRSSFAMLIYVILITSFLFFMVFLLKRYLEASKRRERLIHLREYRRKEHDYIQQADIAEKKIIKLKNEKLRNEMIHRDKELANQTMDLIRKNEFLVKVKEDLEKVKRMVLDESVKKKIDQIESKIDKDIDHEKQWEVFETAFDEVHEDFLQRLKAKYPALTPKELRLCAYLRMNISTKEIAPLMNISVRGVEICRYRVRKKLNIDRDTNLTSLIMNL